MHAARVILVFLLVFAVVAIYSPQARTQALKVWETVRPAVIGITDSLYTVLQSFISSDTSGTRIERRPSPVPDINFLRIVTSNSSATL